MSLCLQDQRKAFLWVSAAETAAQEATYFWISHNSFQSVSTAFCLCSVWTSGIRLMVFSLTVLFAPALSLLLAFTACTVPCRYFRYHPFYYILISSDLFPIRNIFLHKCLHKFQLITMSPVQRLTSTIS